MLCLSTNYIIWGQSLNYDQITIYADKLLITKCKFYRVKAEVRTPARMECGQGKSEQMSPLLLSIHTRAPDGTKGRGMLWCEPQKQRICPTGGFPLVMPRISDWSSPGTISYLRIRTLPSGLYDACTAWYHYAIGWLELRSRFAGIFSQPNFIHEHGNT